VALAIPLCEAPHDLMKVTYCKASLSATPGACSGCPGIVEEPAAEEGNLCVFRGEQQGSLETADEHASFFSFENQKGESPSSERLTMRQGALIIFRTEPFSTTVKHNSEAVLTTAASLNAFGSWALTAD
jgi:hypothetical protein